MNNHVIRCCDLSKVYYDGNTSVEVLKGVQLSLNAGESMAVIGPSGSGKSTLLHLLSGLDKPTGGEIWVHGENWQSLSEQGRCRLRNKQLGFVYQFHHLLPEFTALENVAMPLLLAGVALDKAINLARNMLCNIGLSAREQHKPSQLSGGERQRVAIGRALVHKPSCVFADEPTGNLDHSTALHVFDLMMDLNQQLGTALVIVTHDIQLANRMNRVMLLQDGVLIERS